VLNRFRESIVSSHMRAAKAKRRLMRTTAYCGEENSNFHQKRALGPPYKLTYGERQPQGLRGKSQKNEWRLLFQATDLPLPLRSMQKTLQK
jgi:hypothetical protein